MTRNVLLMILAATAAGIAFRTGVLVVPESLRQGPHVKEAHARVAAGALSPRRGPAPDSAR